jgi:uncharacterized membrane protein
MVQVELLSLTGELEVLHAVTVNATVVSGVVLPRTETAAAAAAAVVTLGVLVDSTTVQLETVEVVDPSTEARTK